MVKKRNQVLTKFEQSDSGNSYQAVGDVVHVPTLAPGMYSIRVTPFGLYFDVKNLSTDNLLRLPDTKADGIVLELAKFWTLGAAFKKYGFVHKRGFLMYGPPGSGKTCTIAQVCEHMTETGGVVLFGDCHPFHLVAALQQLREIEPDRNVVVVMEDFDTLISNFGESGYLALLDGETSIPGVVYVATTNYINRLPDRIKNRPSRFDTNVEIGMPSLESRLLYLKSRNVDETDTELLRWAKAAEGLSLAHLKEIVISIKCLGHDLDETIKRLTHLKDGQGDTDDLADEDFSDEDVTETEPPEDPEYTEGVDDLVTELNAPIEAVNQALNK